MNIADIVIAAIALNLYIEVYHHSQIATLPRMYFDSVKNEFINSLMSCMFCLSIWVAGFITILFTACTDAIFGAYMPRCTLILKALFIYTPAVARLAQFINDYIHDWSRTPKVTDVVENLLSGSSNKEEI